MQFRNFGRSGLKVSPISLGTYNFGSVIDDEKVCFELMSHAIDQGINLFDTADHYGLKWGGFTAGYKGLTEEIIGRWLQEDPSRRNRIILATKLAGDMVMKEGVYTEHNIDNGGFSALKIIRACDSALLRLKTDRIDLFQFHFSDLNCPWDEAWQAMDTLIKQGKIIYVGASNMWPDDLCNCHLTAKALNMFGLLSYQPQYNLAHRQFENERLNAICLKHGLGTLPFSVTCCGLLTGALRAYDKGGRRGHSKDFEASLERNRSKLEPYEKLCDTIGVPPDQVAIAWLLHQKAVTSPIIGPRTMEQLDSSIKAVDVTLTEDVLKQLEAIWVGGK